MCRNMYSRNLKDKYSITTKLSPYVSFVRLILKLYSHESFTLLGRFWTRLNRDAKRKDRERMQTRLP
jgi:hypothetical protein